MRLSPQAPWLDPREAVSWGSPPWAHLRMASDPWQLSLRRLCLALPAGVRTPGWVLAAFLPDWLFALCLECLSLLCSDSGARLIPSLALCVLSLLKTHYYPPKVACHSIKCLLCSQENIKINCFIPYLLKNILRSRLTFEPLPPPCPAAPSPA